MGEKVRLSVVVITKDEEANIVACLESVKWADEIIVVDDESVDRTREFARRYTDKIYIKKMEIEGAHRNYACSLAENEWILSLDADERVSPELQREIKEALRKEPKYSAFSIPFRNYIGNCWIKYGGWYPSEKLRFFRKNAFRCAEQYIHPLTFLEGKCGHLKCDIIHYNYRNFEDLIRKTNRQTSLQAKEWFIEKRKFSWFRVIRTFFDRFIKRYFFKKGYRDGFIGLMIAFSDSLYQLLSYAKYWEILKKEGKKTNSG